MQIKGSLRRCLTRVALPPTEISTPDVIEVKHRPASRFVRVVALGGGTGLANLLKGLKPYIVPDRPLLASGTYISSLSAVVTVTDDGGSSGRLREEFNILPPGDIRNCIAALGEDEALLSRLFQHRFQAGSGLNGHSFGNLFLIALTAMTGDFAEAVNLPILRNPEHSRTHISGNYVERTFGSGDGRR